MKRTISKAGIIFVALLLAGCGKNSSYSSESTLVDSVTIEESKEQRKEETSSESLLEVSITEPTSTGQDSIEEKEEVVFCENAEKFASDILEKVRTDYYSEEQDYEMDVEIYRKRILHAPSGELYYFRISTMPVGEGDVTYIIKETKEGMKVLFEEVEWSRNRYNIYDGVYVQNCGSSGAANTSEDLYYLDFEKELIYSFKTDRFKSYLDYGYEQDFGSKCHLAKDFEKAGISEFDLDRTLVELFFMDGKWVWRVDLPEEINKDSAYQIINSSDISDSIIVCYDKESFSSEFKGMLEEKGVDLEKIYKNDPVEGESESFIWYMHYSDNPRRK